jgi:hypothetical protein
LLVSVLGPQGGAIAVVIGEATLTVALLIVLARTDRNAVPSGRFALRLVLSTALGAMVILIPINGWLQAIVAVIVFVLAAVATGAVPRETLTALTRRRGIS